MTTHYDTLKVTRDADDVVIESAYRALMKKYHPDKTNGDLAATERAKLINAAYSTLRDPQARERYDRTLMPVDRDTGHRPEQQSPHERDLTPAREPRVDRSGSSGWPTSLAFMALALTVATGAIGSLMQNSGPQPSGTPPTAVDVDGDGAETSQPSDPPIAQDDPGEPEAPPLLAAPEFEQSASESCMGLPSAVEYLVCADPALADADERLNTAFSAQPKSANESESLRADQNAWYAKRDGLPADRERILQAYEDRIRELQASDLEGLY